MLKVHAYEYSAWAIGVFDQHIARLLSAHAGRARAGFGIADGSVWPRRRSRVCSKTRLSTYMARHLPIWLRSTIMLLFCVACLMVLMGEGRIAELEACGVRLSMVDQSYLCARLPDLWRGSRLSGVLRVWARRITRRLRLRKLGGRGSSRTCIRGRPGFCLRRADAMRRWAWPMRFWTADAVVEACRAVWGRSCPDRAWRRTFAAQRSAMIDADKPAPEPTPAEALGVYLAAVSVCNTKLARYMASVIECAGDQAAQRTRPCYLENSPGAHDSPFTATMTWGFPPTLFVQETGILRACSTCCPRISRSSAT